METKELIERLRHCGERMCHTCEDVESCVGPNWLLLKAAERLEAVEEDRIGKAEKE